MGVLVGVSVGVCVGVVVAVGVSVGVCVGVLVGVSVGVFVGVFVGVCVGVDVAVGVSVGVSVGVGVDVRILTVSDPVLLVSLLSRTLLSGSTVAVLGRFPPTVEATLNVMLNEPFAGRETGLPAAHNKAVPVIEQLIVPVGGVLPLVTVSAPCG